MHHSMTEMCGPQGCQSSLRKDPGLHFICPFLTRSSLASFNFTFKNVKLKLKEVKGKVKSFPSDFALLNSKNTQILTYLFQTEMFHRWNMNIDISRKNIFKKMKIQEFNDNWSDFI